MSLPEVHSIDKRGYLQEELQVKVDPDKLLKYEIPFNTVMRQIRENHVRRPAGSLEAEKEPRVTLLSELDTPEELRELIVQGGFDGQVIRLGAVAGVEAGYEKTTTIRKANGYEAVTFSVVNQGKTWQSPRVLVDFVTATDGGYPTSMEMPDGVIATAYYCNGIPAHQRYHMGVVRWSLT